VRMTEQAFCTKLMKGWRGKNYGGGGRKGENGTVLARSVPIRGRRKKQNEKAKSAKKSAKAGSEPGNRRKDSANLRKNDFQVKKRENGAWVKTRARKKTGTRGISKWGPA